jgi:3D (Asp-Asp-Asp) domain-containing protein
MMKPLLFITSALPLCLLILTACSTLQKILPEEERTLLVTATAFNSIPNQNRGNPDVGAWGDRIAPGMKVIAVSADLVPLGLTRGTTVRIDGLPDEYVVLDRMPPQWKKRIDIYMGNDVRAARSWGRRAVNIYWAASTGPKP